MAIMFEWYIDIAASVGDNAICRWCQWENPDEWDSYTDNDQIASRSRSRGDRDRQEIT